MKTDERVGFTGSRVRGPLSVFRVPATAAPHPACKPALFVRLLAVALLAAGWVCPASTCQAGAARCSRQRAGVRRVFDGSRVRVRDGVRDGFRVRGPLSVFRVPATAAPHPAGKPALIVRLLAAGWVCPASTGQAGAARCSRQRAAVRRLFDGSCGGLLGVCSRSARWWWLP
jgi:hypothetical protein